MKLQLHYGAKLLIDLMALQYSLWDKKKAVIAIFVGMTVRLNGGILLTLLHTTYPHPCFSSKSYTHT
jgi:hypothetical protein